MTHHQIPILMVEIMQLRSLVCKEILSFYSNYHLTFGLLFDTPTLLEIQKRICLNMHHKL